MPVCVFVCVYVYGFCTDPSARAGYDKRSIF